MSILSKQSLEKHYKRHQHAERHIRPVSAGDLDGTDIFLSSTLATNKLFIGNASNIATAVLMSGDATIVASGALTLANTSVTSGSYGSATQVATFTVDSKGRLTAATNVSISGISITPNRETQTAIASQTVFTLGFSYVVGSKSLLVFLNGLLVDTTDDYIETNSTTITFAYSLDVGDKVIFIGL